MTEAERIERAAEALDDFAFRKNADGSYLNKECMRDDARIMARAAITAYLGGDVVVPREPTQVMIDAARNNGFEGDDDHVRSDYRAMISAAEMEG